MMDLCKTLISVEISSHSTLVQLFPQFLDPKDLMIELPLKIWKKIGMNASPIKLDSKVLELNPKMLLPVL